MHRRHLAGRRPVRASLSGIHATSVHQIRGKHLVALICMMGLAAANGPAAAQPGGEDEQVPLEQPGEAPVEDTGGTETEQDTGGEATLDVGEVSVTANRTPTPLQAVGASVTVITSEQIEAQQIQQLSDVLRQVPGVVVSGFGGDGSLTEVRIRGAETNHTLVLIDGVRVNDPSSVGAAYDFAHLQASDVERVEVLRGPQSALYPSDAIGGVINIITKRGDGPPTVTASVEGGSFGTVLTTGSVSYGDEDVDVRGGVSYFRNDGISIGSDGIEDDGYENLSLTFSGGVRPTEWLSVDLTARYIDSERELDDQAPLDGANFFENEEISGRLQTTLTFLDGAWVTTGGLNYTSFDRPQSDTTGSFIDSRFGSNSFGGDLQSSYLVETPELANTAHTFTVAFAHLTEDGDFEPRGAPAVEESITNTSIAGDYQLNLDEQLFVTASLRHDFNSDFPDATTYRFTGAYVNPDWGTRVHGSYGTGVKNPTLNDLFVDFPTFFFFGNPDLEQERSTGFDIGIEQPFFDDQLSIDVTFFRNWIENLTAVGGTFPRFFIVNIPGTSLREGVEVSATAAITDDIDLVGHYTYTFADQADGQRLLNVPRHTVGASAIWRFLEGDGTLSASLVGEYGRLSQDFSLPGAPRVALDGFTLVDVAASYAVTENVEVFGRVENLLDQDYETRVGFANPGIAAYGGVRVTFGVE